MFKYIITFLPIIIIDAAKVDGIKGDKKGCIIKAKPLEAKFSWENDDLILKSLICPQENTVETEDKKDKKKKKKKNKVTAKEPLEMYKNVPVREAYEAYKPDDKTLDKAKTDFAKCKAAVGELGKRTTKKKKGFQKLLGKSGNDEIIKYLCQNRVSEEEETGEDKDEEEEKEKE